MKWAAKCAEKYSPAGFIPDTLDLSIVDRVEQVDSAEAIAFAWRLIREEGILGGISSGAAAAVRLAQLPDFAGQTIVTVLPDAGELSVHRPVPELGVRTLLPREKQWLTKFNHQRESF